ncbi:FMRFamide-related neuropeptides-like [Macrobrachium rosenbergii]|uniref:FMRFamide-related neuropeptides-like n=1 Tax=Macrobrachium rosenbergii TaxID=79674 RepID=UPI0034D5B459
MIIATWLLLAVLSCVCQALAPPVTVALESSTGDEAAHDDSVALPSKRILKYFLPSAQAWATHGAGVAVPTGSEGNKRGYGDRNFLRFGRSGDAVKKDGGRNFLRFGRGGNEEYEDDEDGAASVEKRDRNFLRFGRDRNFLRFGRSGPEELGLEDESMEEERGDLENYLRYSRADKNFLRFGRNYDKNFLRFGRSVDSQTLCDDCEEENLNKHPKSASPPSSFPATTVSGEQDGDGNYKLGRDAKTTPSADTQFPSNEKKEVRRSKREASAYFDSSISGPHGPAFWGRNNLANEEQEDESLSLDDLQEVAKRPYSRDFLRFGRDRNFLRFGKRFDGASPESDLMMMTPLQYTSKRVSHNNFLRFG